MHSRYNGVAFNGDARDCRVPVVFLASQQRMCYAVLNKFDANVMIFHGEMSSPTQRRTVYFVSFDFAYLHVLNVTGTYPLFIEAHSLCRLRL